MFNIINTTLTKHGLLGITLKQSIPTIINVNYSYFTPLNIIMYTINGIHCVLIIDLHTLERQHHDTYDTHITR